MTKESNKKIKIIALILVIILILAAVGSFIGVIVFNKSNRKIQAIDFFEKAPINMVFDLEQTQNINNILEEKYVAVNNRAGFSAFSDNISLYEMYGIYKLADSINNNEIKDTLKNNIEDLKKIDITNLDMLNLYYYLFLCKEYNVSVNVNAIKSVLDKHYDNDMHLFNIFGENDLLANKIWISGNVLTVLSDLDYYIQNGLSKVFSTYQFKLPISGDTLYNSGGDIIYALNQNGLLDLIVRSNMNDWFEAWEEEYSDFSIKDDSTALIYSSFLDIVEIFAPDSLDSNDLMQKYFESLLVSQIPDSFDPNLWSTIMKYVKTPQNNMEIFNRILSSANEDISNLVISNKNIDVAETAFGIALANATGFEINKDYINNTLNDIYSNYVVKSSDPYDMAYYLYYYLYAFEINNDYSPFINNIPFSVSELQNIVNKILDSLTYSNDMIMVDLMTARYTIDVIANMNLFNVDLHISNKQAKKIINALSKFADENNQNSTFMIDLYRLDYILSSNVFSESYFIKLTALLKKEDQGFCSENDEDSISNIYSSYLMFSACQYFNNFNLLKGLKEYVEELEMIPGVFRLSKIDEPNLRSVFYGNVIKQIEISLEDK